MYSVDFGAKTHSSWDLLDIIETPKLKTLFPNYNTNIFHDIYHTVANARRFVLRTIVYQHQLLCLVVSSTLETGFGEDTNLDSVGFLLKN